MTPQDKAARDEAAEEYVAPRGGGYRERTGHEAVALHEAVAFSDGYDAGYAQGQVERQAERTAELALLAGQAEEIERLKHANRAAEYERDEWRRQAENLAKALKSLDDVFEEGHTVIAAEALREYAAWKGEK